MKGTRAVIFLLTFLPSISWAADNYKCKVIEAKDLEKKGLLEVTPFSKLIAGQEFVVERATGKIIGGTGFSNHNGEFGQPKVIDKGSKEQSYKALTIFGPNVAVAYLQIEEYLEQKEKPFMLFSNSNSIINGVCVHF